MSTVQQGTLPTPTPLPFQATNLTGVTQQHPLQSSVKMHPNIMLQGSAAMNTSKSTVKPAVHSLSSSQQGLPMQLGVPIQQAPGGNLPMSTSMAMSENYQPGSTVTISSQQQMSYLNTHGSVSGGVLQSSSISGVASMPVANSSNPMYQNMRTMLNSQSQAMPQVQPSMNAQPQISAPGQGISQLGQIVSTPVVPVVSNPGGPQISPHSGPTISPPGGPAVSPPTPAYGMTNIPNVITVNVNGVNCLYTVQVTPAGPKLVPLNSLGSLQNALAPQAASSQAGPVQPQNVAQPMAPVQQTTAMAGQPQGVAQPMAQIQQQRSTMPSVQCSMPAQPPVIQNQPMQSMQQNIALSQPNSMPVPQPRPAVQQAVPGVPGPNIVNQTAPSPMPVPQQPVRMTKTRIITVDHVRRLPGFPPRSLLRPQNIPMMQRPPFNLCVTTETRPPQPRGIVIYSQSQTRPPYGTLNESQNQGKSCVEVVDLTASKPNGNIDLSGSGPLDGNTSSSTSHGIQNNTADTSQSGLAYDAMDSPLHSTSRSISSSASVISKSLNALLNTSQSSISDDDTTTILENMKKLVKSTATLNTSRASINTDGDDSLGSIIPNSQADSSSGILPGFALDATDDSLPPAIFSATSACLSKPVGSEKSMSREKLPNTETGDTLDTTNDSLPPAEFIATSSSAAQQKEPSSSMTISGKTLASMDTTDDSDHLAIFNEAYSSSSKPEASSENTTTGIEDILVNKSDKAEGEGHKVMDISSSDSDEDDDDLPPSLLTPLRVRVNAPLSLTPDITQVGASGIASSPAVPSVKVSVSSPLKDKISVSSIVEKEASISPPAKLSISSDLSSDSILNDQPLEEETTIVTCEFLLIVNFACVTFNDDNSFVVVHSLLKF